MRFRSFAPLVIAFCVSLAACAGFVLPPIDVTLAAPIAKPAEVATPAPDVPAVVEAPAVPVEAPAAAPVAMRDLTIVVHDAYTGQGIKGAKCQIYDGALDESRVGDGSGFLHFPVPGVVEARCSADGYMLGAGVTLPPGGHRIALLPIAKPPAAEPTPATAPPVDSPAPGVPSGKLSISDVVRLLKTIHDAEGVNLGAPPASSRESRNAFFERAVGLIHFGSAKYGIAADPRWCVKDGGEGRPMSDDVIVLCATREAWDMIPNAGGAGYRFHADALGVLPAEQNVYPPRRPK